MSIVLYKPGITHTVKGVKCEMGLFDANELEPMLKEGWSTELDGLYDETPKKTSKKKASKKAE